MGWIIFNSYYSNLDIHVWENIHSRHHPTQSVIRLEASQVLICTGIIWSLVEMQVLTLQPWAGVCACVCIRLCIRQSRLFVTPWTVDYQAPPSMGLFRQKTGMGCHFPPPGILLTQGLNLCLLHCRRILYLLSHQEVQAGVWDPAFLTSLLPAPLGSQQAMLSLLVWGPHAGEPGRQSSLSAAANSH